MSYAFNLARPNRLVKIVNVKLNGDNPSLKFSSARSEIFVEGSFEVFYRGRSNDTLITYESREKKMENQEFIDVLITDLELLLNEVSDRLDEFNVTFRWCGVEQVDLAHLQNVYDQLTLITSHKKINACSVELAVEDIDQVRIAYTCFDLQTLRHCAFHFVDNQFEDPANAFRRILEIDELKFLDSIEAHFKVENLSIDGLIAIKQVVIDSGRKCKAVIDNSNGNNLQNQELTNIFGDSIEKYQEWIICRCENLKCYIYESRIEIQTKEWKSTPSEKYMRDRRMGSCSEDSEDEDFKLWRESMDIPKRKTSSRPSSYFKEDSSTNGASPKDGLPSTTEDETSELRRKWKTIPERDFNMMLELVITKSLIDSNLVPSTDGESRHSKSSESNINNNMLELEAKRSLLFSKDDSSNVGKMAKRVKFEIMQSLLDPENNSSTDGAGLLDNLPSTSDNRTPRRQRHLEHSMESFDNIMLEAAIKQSLLDLKGDCSADGTRPKPDLSDNKTRTSRERSESSEENSDSIMLKYAIELSLLDSKEDASKIEAITKKLKLELAKLKLRITQSLSDSKDDSLSNEANLQNDLPSTSDSKTPTSRERSESSESNISNILRELENEQSLLDSKNDSSNPEYMMKMLKLDLAKLKLVFFQAVLDAKGNSATDETRPGDVPSLNSEGRTPTSRKRSESSESNIENILLKLAMKESLLESKDDSSTNGASLQKDLPSTSDDRTPTSRKLSENFEENSDNIMLKYAIELSLLDSKKDSTKIEAIPEKLKFELAKLKLGLMKSLSNSKDDPSTNGASLQNDLPSTSDDRTPTSRERSESSESNISNIMRKLEIEQSLLDSKNDSSNPESMMKMLKLDLAKLKLVFFQGVLDAKGNSATDETRPGDVLSLNSEGRNPTSRKRSEISESNIENKMIKLAMKESLLGSEDGSSTDGAMAKMLKMALVQSLLGSDDYSSSDEASTEDDPPSNSDNKTPTSGKRLESYESRIENILLKLAMKESLLESKDDSSTNGASLQKDLPSTSDDRTPTSRKLSENFEENSDNIMLKYAIELSLLDSKKDSSKIEAITKKLTLELAKLKLGITQSLSDSKEDPSTNEASPEDDLPSTSDNRTPTSRERSERSESNIDNKMNKLTIKQSLLDSIDDYSTDRANPEDDLPSTSDEKTPTNRKRSESSESSFDNFMLKLAIKTSLSDLKDDSLTNGASPEVDLLSTSDNKTPTNRKRSQVSESNINNKIVKFATIQSLLNSIDDYSIDGESPEDDLPSTSDKKTPTSRKRSQFSESNINSKRHKFATMQSLLDSKVYSSNNGASPEDDLPSTSQIRSSTMQRRSEIYQQGLSKFHMLLSMAAVHSAFDSRNTSSTEAVPDNDPDSEDSRRHKEHFQNLLLNVNNMIRHSRITQNSSDSKSNCKKEQTGSSHRALTNRLIMSLILQRVGLKTISSLRQVSRGIRRCVDGIKSDSKIEALAISLDTIDRVKIEMTDKTINKKHVFQTVYNDSYKKFWNDKKSMNMNDEYTYPSYELYHFPNNIFERGQYYPLATAFSKSSKQNVVEWYQKRLCSFTYILRHSLLNQKKPIESFSISLPWFINERGSPEFYSAGYHFISMFGHEVPMYTKFLDLKIESRACEQCRKTDEVRNLASCDVHQKMFQKLLEENREICGPNSGHPDYQNRPITYTQDEYEQRIDLFVKYFEDILSSVGHTIPVEALYMQACNQNTVLRVLRHLDSRLLKTISIKIVEDDQDKPCNWVLPLEINEICELDQWKFAENIEVEHLIDTDDVRHFGHFSEANLKLTRLTMEGILSLKITFLRSHNFIKFKASFETSDINVNIFRETLLGLAHLRPLDPNKPTVWFYEYPESKGYFLKILYYGQAKRIIFSRVDA